ncbi:hypothetical protein QCI42_15425 [Bacillus fungorum]|uniref:hypothetical protein n=1 Tax=Bacillus fungorum TaxID=2039284 RepID=UPI00339A27D3
MNDVIQKEIQELLETVNNPEHPEYEETITSMNFILGFMTQDFSVTELEEATKRFYNSLAKKNPVTEEFNKEVYETTIMIRNPDVQKKFEELFYSFHKFSGFCGEILKHHCYLNTDRFIEKVHEYYHNEVMQQIEGLDDTFIDIANSQYQLLQNRAFVNNIKKQYIIDQFRSDFYRCVGHDMGINQTKDVKSSFFTVLRNFRTSDESFNTYADTKEGTEYIQVTFQQLINPDIQKNWNVFLKKEEELGYIAYQEMVASLRGLLRNRIKNHLFFSKYLYKKHYKLEIREDKIEFLHGFFYFGPESMAKIYGKIHSTIIFEIYYFFLNLINTFPTPIEEEKIKKIEDEFCRLAAEHQNYLDNELYRMLHPFAEKFGELFEYVGELGRRLKKSRDQDFKRGLLSAFSFVSLLKNMFRIYEEETSFDDNLTMADKKVWQLYEKYRDSLPIIEEKLLHFYDDYYEKIFKKLFLPFIKNIFFNLYPVRRCFGIINFEDELLKVVQEIHLLNEEIEPNHFEGIFKEIENRYYAEKENRVMGSLNNLSFYINQEYFRKKKLNIAKNNNS